MGFRYRSNVNVYPVQDSLCGRVKVNPQLGVIEKAYEASADNKGHRKTLPNDVRNLERVVPRIRSIWVQI